MSYLKIGLNTNAVFIDQFTERARLYRAQNFLVYNEIQKVCNFLGDIFSNQDHLKSQGSNLEPWI